MPSCTPRASQSATTRSAASVVRLFHQEVLSGRGDAVDKILACVGRRQQQNRVDRRIVDDRSHVRCFGKAEPLGKEVSPQGIAGVNAGDVDPACQVLERLCMGRRGHAKADQRDLPPAFHRLERRTFIRTHILWP